MNRERKPEISNSTTRNFGLDLIRATAILLVCGIHVIQQTYIKDAYIFWYGAYFGVELFFVLSGFLIGDLILRIYNPVTRTIDKKKLLVFIYRRWFRTVPAYFVALFLNFIAAKYLLDQKVEIDIHYFTFTTFFF